MVHGGRSHISIVDAVISNALYSGSDVLQVFSLEDAEDISSLYLQVNLLFEHIKISSRFSAQ